MAQDSSLPGFWDTRYRGGVTPWDAGRAPPFLQSWLTNLSDAAIEAARRELGAAADRVKKADFFSFATAPYDLVYERAFLCALPRRIWPQWATRTAELVQPGGELAGFFFFDDNERGPPFGISAPELGELLLPWFEMSEDVAIPAQDSLPVFRGKERWQAWERKL